MENLRRLFSCTDDLGHQQLIDLLFWLVQNNKVKIRDLKKWRRLNDLIVDRED